MWSLRKYGPPHGVFKMLFHFKWPFKEIVQSSKFNIVLLVPCSVIS